MDGFWQQLLLPPPIAGVTINTVWIGPVARAFLYGVTAVAFAAGLLAYLAKRYPAAGAFRRALLTALVAAGMLYALRADIGWSVWLTRDLTTFGGLTTEEKLLKLDGALYDFSRRARSVVSGDYMIYATDPYLVQRTEYFLLPLRKRNNAPIIIVLADPTAIYDPAGRTFTRGGVRLDNVTLLMQYGTDAYIVSKQ
jgi:hypothetical protein